MPSTLRPSASSAPTAADILTELKALGKEGYKNMLLRHCVAEPVFGVSIEELKKIQKRIKKDYCARVRIHPNQN